MQSNIQSWLRAVDWLVAAGVLPIALGILISGLDDLLLDVLCSMAWLRRRWSKPATASLFSSQTYAQPEKRIAVFVPLWKEHLVIAGMVEHNIAAIRYEHYDIFIGAYPNDEPTLDAVRDLETRFPRVHLAVCPHNGPTSKADCLNWIYQRMLLFEEAHDTRFELIVTHDAEDIVHPEAFSRTNAYSDHYDMVQIPVLPLPTPLWEVVHGIYCDEFAEWQLKDMRARMMLGSFLPSNGVGTGYTRSALEKLAIAEHNLIFEPACLTEDYENGLRLYLAGCAQVFVPISISSHGMVATREYFPRTLKSAIRQRTRWIMGIALQTWERHGWSGNLAQVYWFWRDRKGLFGNPLSLLTNLILVYGLAMWTLAKYTGTPWDLSRYLLYPRLLALTSALQIFRLAVRAGYSSRVYGFRFALGVPVRTVCANYINSAASLYALYHYFRAKLRNEPLRWVKTEHAYPSRSALQSTKRRLGEILAGSGYVTPEELEDALRTQPSGMRLGEYLLKLGKLTEQELYEALSLQQSLPAGPVDPVGIPPNVARALPRDVMRNWKVLPYRIASGNLFLATPEIPSDELTGVLRGLTGLALRFQLVTPENFERLAATLL